MRYRVIAIIISLASLLANFESAAQAADSESTRVGFHGHVAKTGGSLEEFAQAYFNAEAQKRLNRQIMVPMRAAEYSKRANGDTQIRFSQLVQGSNTLLIEAVIHESSDGTYQLMRISSDLFHPVQSSQFSSQISTTRWQPETFNGMRSSASNLNKELFATQSSEQALPVSSVARTYLARMQERMDAINAMESDYDSVQRPQPTYIPSPPPFRPAVMPPLIYPPPGVG